MNTYIGIDLGTSGAKFLLVTADGKILEQNTQKYTVYYPSDGWSEQNPEDWYYAALTGIGKLLQGHDAKNIKGISFGGQMHGLVILDKDDNVIRPAILWNDGRTAKQIEYLNEVIGKEKLSEYTANIAFAGFTAPKLLWLKENEPQNFEKISKIMLPKDYLTYRLSGKFVTDYSDASGTLLLDVKNRCWSDEMCKICGVKKDLLPELCESYNAVGTLKSEIADTLGLSHDVSVVTGAGDNAAAAIGTGIVKDGACNISLGTSGTVFVASEKFSPDKSNSLHCFCHADGKFHVMGCILSAASCNSWWAEKILGVCNFGEEQSGLKELCGKNEVYFLPYLMGERSPHNDVCARGAFIGMRPDTSRKKMTLAVLEGVAFALKDCLEKAKEDGIVINSSTICGGGAKSELWRHIIADVLNIPICRPSVEEGPAYGAAILAMVGCKEYPSVKIAAEKLVKVNNVTQPDSEKVKIYAKKYEIFKTLYPTLKDCFKKMSEN